LRPRLSLGLLELPMGRQVGLGDLRAARTAGRHALSLAVDVLHGHGAKGGAYARLAARSVRRRGRPIRCFYTPHGGSLHYSPATLHGRAYLAVERWLETHTDGIIFESAYSARVYAAHVRNPGCPARVIHNGLLPSEFEPVVADVNAADFLFVGELRRLKGVDVLLEAMARVLRQRPASAEIVGSGADGDLFHRQADGLGLAGKVTFRGALPAREAFRLGRTLILPSRAESLPYVALEAAAAGLPLIATRVGGLPEIVAGTDTPLVDPGSPGALADAMLWTLEHPVEARSRALHLNRVVGGRFTAAAMGLAVMEFYRPRDPMVNTQQQFLPVS
jgi:glycosyltransferase involved in cell wall biosynthesis